MGAHPYWYVVPYEADANVALQNLREREFQAGRYNPVMPFLKFPIDSNSPSPGAGHASIEQVLETANEDGTRSILDIARVAPTPFDGSEMPFFTAFPLSETDLVALFGTPRPTLQTVQANTSMWDRIERGSAICVTLFVNNEPRELFFAGYSFD